DAGRLQRIRGGDADQHQDRQGAAGRDRGAELRAPADQRREQPEHLPRRRSCAADDPPRAAAIGPARERGGGGRGRPRRGRLRGARRSQQRPHDVPVSRRSPPSASVIVCAYTLERWSILCEAVDSLRRQSVPPLEILVVIDHNPELLHRAGETFEDVRVLDNGGPQGSSEAKNSAILAARGEVLAFLDDDAVAEPSWLEEMLAPYEDPSVLGTCGAPVPRWAEGSRPGWMPEEFLWTVGGAYRGLPREPRAVRNPIGAAMSFRASVFDQVGLFHGGLGPNMSTPAPHGGGEDTELGIRTLQANPGCSLIHVPGARVHHHVPEERTRFSYFLRRCWLEGRAKALLSVVVGMADGLSSERSYVLAVLPSGIARGLRAGVGGDRSAPARAGAILAGLTCTAGGWAWERLRISLRGTPC